jgi:hypothetical protein
MAMMLYRFRSGDANMRSVWLCSRNDAIGNLAVILAAIRMAALPKALRAAQCAPPVGKRCRAAPAPPRGLQRSAP